MFICETCEKAFERYYDYVRHINKKNICYKSLQCNRCHKMFDKKSHYIQHISRKIQCNNKNDELLLHIRIEELKLQQEQEKTRQIILTNVNYKNIKPQIITQIIDNNIIFNNPNFNITINNINNLDLHNMTIEEARNNYNPDILKMISNIFKHQYNSDDEDLKNNKCIKLDNNKYIIKIDDDQKKVKFSEIRYIILDNFKKLIISTIDNFYPSDRRIEEVADYLTKEIIDKYENSVDFTYNVRNSGLINKALKSVVA